MAKIISGKDLAASLKAEMAAKVAEYPEKYGRAPKLAVILVGDDPASQTYVRNKAKACETVGITNMTVRMPAETTEEELLSTIASLNRDDSVDGILVQLPVPKHISEVKVIEAIAHEKDVDGFHPLNTAALWQKRPNSSCVIPCTPEGIIKLLESAGCEIAGKNAVVIGRSQIVGLPVAKLLLDECHGDHLPFQDRRSCRDYPPGRHPRRGYRQGKVRDRGHGQGRSSRDRRRNGQG